MLIPDAYVKQGWKKYTCDNCLSFILGFVLIVGLVILIVLVAKESYDLGDAKHKIESLKDSDKGGSTDSKDKNILQQIHNLTLSLSDTIKEDFQEYLSKLYFAGEHEKADSHDQFEDLQTVRWPPFKEWTIIMYHDLLQSNIFENSGWDAYVNGFGSNDWNSSNAYWMGLEPMRNLTLIGHWRLLVAVKYLHNYDGGWDLRRDTWGWGIWDGFHLNKDRYMLDLGNRIRIFNMGEYDAMDYHRGKVFSTRDRDNDNSPDSCAQIYGGGWWYGRCRNACPTCRAKSRTWYDTQTRYCKEALMAVVKV